ncbi:eCIS core domain-containing protein [Tenacibaculum agarivorans]|uniref:eCIS core domain-containing protein n=1 Tax=Tenacibaculum agarivorans TaxID=1908389 RepID=UPI0009F98BB2|nr:DUF4157 domain-containing protein [Tenacibaculum agarivorans]
MSNLINKNNESKNETVASANVQLQENNDTTFQLVDNRKEAVVQQQLVDKPIQKKPNNTGLPDNLKSGIENMSGYSMDDVKVHYNSNKPAQLNAHAYAQGTDIHVASGQEQHVPHEAWHVVQQKQGRVQPTTAVNGAQVNDNVGLETEADVMGAKALQMRSKNSSTTITSSDGQKKQQSLQMKKGVNTSVTQRKIFISDNTSTGKSLLSKAQSRSNPEEVMETIKNAMEDDSTNFTFQSEIDVIHAAERSPNYKNWENGPVKRLLLTDYEGASKELLFPKMITTPGEGAIKVYRVQSDGSKRVTYKDQNVVLGSPPMNISFGEPDHALYYSNDIVITFDVSAAGFSKLEESMKSQKEKGADITFNDITKPGDKMEITTSEGVEELQKAIIPGTARKYDKNWFDEKVSGEVLDKKRVLELRQKFIDEAYDEKVLKNQLDKLFDKEGITSETLAKMWEYRNSDVDKRLRKITVKE